MAPLSIIVTNYNKTLAQINECFQSIRDQTIAPAEIIFVDDHSDSPVVPPGALSLMLPERKGVAHARDIGVRMSTQKLLLFVDADDKLSPDFIQQCGYSLRGKVQSGADIAYPNMIYFGDVERNTLHKSPDEITASYLLGKTIDIPVTSMMYREVYEKNKGFQELPVFEDWDFWIRALANGFTFKRANTLLWYRQSANSRNHKSRELRADVLHKIQAPYRLSGKGEIVWDQNETK